MILTAFWLKIIAVTGMILQHMALALPGAFPLGVEIFLQISGGLTFPILAFLLVDGFRATSNLSKYMTRLAVFGVISFVPHLFVLGTGLNIMFTMALSLYLLKLRRERGNSASFWAIFVVLILACAFLDWGIIGPIGVILYDMIKNEKARRIVVPLFFIAGVLLQGLLVTSLMSLFIDMEYLMAEMDMSIAPAFFPVGTLLAIPLLLLYNGERGRPAKWFFYVIYPLHLAVLAIVSIAMGKNVLINMIRNIFYEIGNLL
ncbi:MAG: conjugal transfer protein TraX [Defluviitaleaceae bacterium]|nr:conjugal transfer protein TraX [Defluviitaleaceae bacterium]